jgi:hypothetical protein
MDSIHEGVGTALPQEIVSEYAEDFFGSSRRSAMPEKVPLNEAAGDATAYGN